MKTNNALVTYTDLTTMGLIQKPGANPPSGNQCATKDFILTNYYADTAALSGYTGNRLPPYQDIVLQTTPFLLCYNLTITNNSYPGCNSYTDTFETWTISLIDQFGNAYYTPTTLTFEVQYDYYEQEDIPPYTINDTLITNLNVNAGQYQGFGQFGTYTYRNCAMSGICDGSCYSTSTNVQLISAPLGISGGCSLPPPPPPGPCAYTQILFSGGFSPNGDGIDDTWQWQGKRGGTWELLNYTCYPNAVWEIFDLNQNVWYANFSGAVYVPWNGKYNNVGVDAIDGTYFYSINLGDGAGFRRGFLVLVRP